MSFVNSQRILTQERIEKLLKKNLPLEKAVALSLVKRAEGMTENTAKDYIKDLFRLDIIGFNDDGLLEWNAYPKPKAIKRLPRKRRKSI